MAYKLIVGFAAVGIINGVFMQETFKVAASDDKLMMRQKATGAVPFGRCLSGQERDRMLHTKKMKTLFEAADESGDGYIAAWRASCHKRVRTERSSWRS